MTSLASQSLKKINYFRSQSEHNYVFVCQAAIPLVLTPDLLYQLWNNFKVYQYVDEPLESFRIPSIAISDFLLSGLCREVNIEIFEMEKEIRDLLLTDLVFMLGEKRKNTIAKFLEEYAENEYRLGHRQDLRDLHQLTALSILSPSKMEEKIIEKINNTKSDSEKMRHLLLHNNLMPHGTESTLKKISSSISDFNNLSPVLIGSQNENDINVLNVVLPSTLKGKVWQIKQEHNEGVVKRKGDLVAGDIIREVKEKRLTQLDLGNCGLTEMPDLSDMDWLETLILSNEWWDLEQKKWVKSQNTGDRNHLITPQADNFPKNLKNLVLGGGSGKNWEIKDTGFLSNLTALTALYLSSNQISDVSFLSSLSGLTTLYLSSNQISDVSFLSSLSGLTTLSLSSNQIIDGSFLSSLSGLTTLYLSSNQIIDVSFLSSLSGLTTLELSDNQIIDGSFLSSLSGLTTLDLSYNQIIDGSFLSSLSGLTTLSLSFNQINDVSFLSSLSGLTTLDLSYNQIIDGSFLSSLSGLTTLYLGRNQINEVSFLSSLWGLTTLELSDNKISNVSFLSTLSGLTTLDLRNNQIIDGSFLSSLSGLTTLSLSFNQISDVSFLASLSGLKTLNLHSNQISDASFLASLSGLTTLNLDSNKISDASFLAKLTHLNKIDLSKNEIDDLSQLQYFFQEKGMKVVWKEWYDTSEGEINVKDNPLTHPPVEIVQRGNEAVLNYFQQIAEQGGTAPLYEARLIMVGEPGAGKTSLTEKLLDEKHVVKPDDPKKKSTLGINVKENWGFEDCRRPGEHFTAHIWDFGGQEIQYMTHQFFLTPESLYVLVADDRKQHTLFPYWFEVIRLLGRDEAHGHSPVLVVLNERSNKSITNFDLNDYRLRYPDMNIQVCEVDLCESNLSRFRQLRARVQEALCHLPQVGRLLPAKWPRIREDLMALKEQGRNHISMATFREVCAAHRVTREEDLALISLYLHRLGAVLHFPQDLTLRDLIVISPIWALKAIYTVLEDKSVEKANGFFTDTDLDRYWHDLNGSERGHILNMMKMASFEIVYPVTGGYIAPQLLSKVRPVFKWDSNGSLKCRFYYRFMPKGILTRLIVRKHAHIKTQEWVWARGVVLHFAGCDILVVEQDTEKDGIIQIEVQGKGRDLIRALDFVRNEIEEIHQKWFSKVDFQPMVPCDCEDCRATVEPTYFKLESLVKRLDQNRQEIECEKGKVKMVPVRRLLEGVYDPSDIARKMDRERGMNIHVHVEDRMAHEKLDRQKAVLDRLEKPTESTELNTTIIVSNQHVHSDYLQDLLHFAGQHQAALAGVFDKIDAIPTSESGDFTRINDLLEERFSALLAKLPETNEIVKAWKEANKKQPHEADSKWKLKFKLPFLFGEIEKEFAWDGKAALRLLRSEVTAFAKGEKTFKELFLEE